MALSNDLAFQNNLGATAAVIGIGVAALSVLWACPTLERQGVPPISGLLLIGIGPFLFFQSLILQNQGWISEITGMDGPQSQMVIALLNVVTLIAVVRFERNRLATLAALAILVGAIATAEGGAIPF